MMDNFEKMGLGGLKGLLHEQKARRDEWMKLREKHPGTTCEKFPFTCEQLIQKVLDHEGRTRENMAQSISCRCIDEMKDIEKQQREREMQRALRSEFGRLRPRSEMSLDAFILYPKWNRYQKENAARAKKICLEYAENPYRIPFLTIYGGYGSGKTHLAVGIAQAVDMQVIFANVPELLNHLRNLTGKNNSFRYTGEFERIKSAPLLVLDDMGAEYKKDDASLWADEQIYQIINFRHWEAMPTIITTNDDVFHMDGRIGSRIRDHSTGRIVRLQLPDNRLRSS